MNFLKKATVFFFVCMMHASAYCMNGLTKPVVSLFVPEEVIQAKQKLQQTIAQAHVLNAAIDENNIEGLRKLLDEAPIDLSNDCNAQVCMHKVHKNSFMDKIMDAYDADIRSEKIYFDDACKLPFALAIQQGKTSAVKLLLEYGQNPLRKFVHPQHGLITYALFARICGNPEIMQYMPQDTTIVPRGVFKNKSGKELQQTHCFQLLQEATTKAARTIGAIEISSALATCLMECTKNQHSFSSSNDKKDS